jgi:hypothetical protein
LEGTIRNLLKSGVDKSRIIDFVHLRTGCLLSRLQLALMESPDLPRALVANADELLLCMETEGHSRVLEMEIDGEVKRTAILTITSNDQDNLSRFGDVAFLDGTAIRNELGWTAYPITLIDDERMLASGGLLLTAYERGETFEWLLKNLDQMLGSMLRTIFSDQDSALIPAMANFRALSRGDVAHRLCVFHKRVNFSKQVAAARAAPSVKDVANSLFDEICYSKSEGQVLAACEKIRKLIPGMSDYVETELIALLPLFTEAFRGDALTLGFHATSLSESANRMIKRSLPSQIHSLTEIREGYTRLQSKGPRRDHSGGKWIPAQAFSAHNA